MTVTTREILENYQVRKSKKQKKAFAEYVKKVAEEYGYSFKTEKGLGAENIIIGDPKTAKAVFTAHYDTCSRLPFPNFITPKNILIYILYQLLIVAVFLLVAAVMGVAIGVASVLFDFGGDNVGLIAAGVYWILVLLIFAGPANKNTANDNTSGVTTLLDIMTSMTLEEKQNAAFIFFDLEEAGVIGSMVYALKHRKEMKSKLLLNFDCVSDGDNILFAINKKARGYKEVIEKAFEPNEKFKVEAATKGFFYPSDQANFPCGVGVAALKKTKFLNILYMNRIHTKRDTVYCQENIDYLKDGAIKLINML